MTYPLSNANGSKLLAMAAGFSQRRPVPRRLEQQDIPKNSLQGVAKIAKPAVDGSVFDALVFSAKTFAAAVVALFISFWLGLDEPYWALLTVFIVAQPDSGLVLAKGFYRLLGTGVGVSVTIALVFAFAQYGELFIASLAAWIGVCSFAARGTRNYSAYGFQLAGYTAAIVGLPAALNTSGAYTLIVARLTEITLGIVCAGLVSRLIFPVRLQPKLTALAEQLFHRVDRFTQIAIDPAADQKQVASERQALAKDFGAVETMRSSAFFESADARLVDPPLQDALHAAVDLWAVAEATATRPGPLLEECPNTGGSSRAPDEDPKMVFALQRAADARTVPAVHARLAERLAALAKGKIALKSSPATPLWSDPLTAVITGIRSALAVVITATFWFVTAWPSGPTAVVLAGVVCTLLAPTPQPAKITAAAGVTILAFAVPLFVTQICLLPYASDIFSMAALLAPYLLICAFIIAQKNIGPLGLLSAVYLAVSTHIDNNSAQTYDANAFFNMTLAILLGIGVSVALFATFFPETPRWAARRFFRLVCINLSQIVDAPQPAFSAFNFALCENLASTIGRLKDEPPLARNCLLAGEIGLSSAWAIERLKTGLALSRQNGAMHDPISKLLARLSLVYRSPSQSGLTGTACDARDAFQLVMAKVGTAEGSTVSKLVDLAVGCEALRLNAVKIRTLLREVQNVH